MAIQMRRGEYSKFDAESMLPGEWAVVLSGDSSAIDGKAVYICTSAGVTKRICPKCGHRMRLMPDTEWSLWELHTIDAICPNCLHVERIETIVAERARREE